MLTTLALVGYAPAWPIPQPTRANNNIANEYTAPIIAVNTDPEAPMVTKADYAVIGDMHEVLPAVLDELG